MARLQVNPTRMELIQLRRRLGIAVHGHSLLKDKLEGLMAEFMAAVEKYRVARAAFNRDYPEVIKLFVLTGLVSSRQAVDDALTQSRRELDLTVPPRPAPHVVPRRCSSGVSGVMPVSRAISSRAMW